MRMRTSAAVILMLLLFGPPRPAAQQDPLTTARGLYQSAAYEEALTLLDRMKASPASPSDAQLAGQYRAYCLLALNRQAEADRAIEEVVATDPAFVPSDTEVSPRVRAAFQAVRRRTLPAIVQQRYATAKAAFDRKDYAAATEQFAGLNAILRDADLDQMPGLADLRVLAAGFLDLARSAAPPPSAPKPDVSATPPPPAVPHVYDGSEPGVTAPVIKRQDMPRWPANPMQAIPTKRGMLEVLINEEGKVESAMVRQALDPTYDEMLLAATRAWRYDPALKDGQPVKFVKRIQVIIQ
jgi:TonB family protein